MADKLLGKATVQMDGVTLLSNLDCMYQLADDEGEPVMGDQGLNGITYKPVPGTVELSVSVTNAVDIQKFKPSIARDLTVLVQGDAGGSWVYPHAAQTKAIKATAAGGGKVPLMFVSKTTQKVS